MDATSSTWPIRVVGKERVERGAGEASEVASMEADFLASLHEVKLLNTRFSLAAVKVGFLYSSCLSRSRS